MISLPARRLIAARAALRAHHAEKNALGTVRRLAGDALFNPARNGDLESDLVDLVADVLTLATATGHDAGAVARTAADHLQAEAEEATTERPPPCWASEDSDQSTAWRTGYVTFWDGLPLSVVSANSDAADGWRKAWTRAYGQGVKASLRDGADVENPYPQFSGPWEAWGEGCDAEASL